MNNHVKYTFLAMLGLVVVSGAVYAGETGIGESAARQQALSNLPDGTVARYEMDTKRDGRTVHEYVIVNDTTRVRVGIDANTGEMTSYDRDSRTVPVRGDSFAYAGARPQGRISPDQARQIALEMTNGGQVVEFEQDYKRSGRLVYEMEILADGVKYEVDLDADTGNVVEYDMERKYHHRDRGYRGHRGHCRW